MSGLEFFIYFSLALAGLFYLFGGKSSGRRGKNYPPGPWGFPILGHFPLMTNLPHKKFMEWGKTYGPIIAVEFGMFPTVVINDPKLIRTAFNDLDFAGRPALPTFKARGGGQFEGVIISEGKKWMEQRRFIIRNLRDFGFGKNSMEGAVQEEVKELIEEFRKGVGTPQSTQNKFNAAVLNALWTLIAGERFKQDDPELQVAIKHLTTNFQENTISASLSNFIPPLAKYAPHLSGFDKLMKSLFPILEFLRKPINHHKETFVAGQPRDLIDVYLEEINKTTDSASSFYKENGDKSLLFSILDLFVAGAETTSTTLTWAFLYLAKFPQIQQKLQAEISKVVGDSRLPSLADRPSMPYTEATIHEIMRKSALVPLGVMHNTVKDVEIGGYTIPKNTMIMANTYAVHHDAKIWGDPENFRPERFLNKEGTAFVKDEAFVAFSVGKRVCLGETLARDELFLFITSLFQAFTVALAPNTSKDLSLEGVSAGPVLAPHPHEVVLTARN